MGTYLCTLFTQVTHFLHSNTKKWKEFLETVQKYLNTILSPSLSHYHYVWKSCIWTNIVYVFYISMILSQPYYLKINIYWITNAFTLVSNSDAQQLLSMTLSSTTLPYTQQSSLSWWIHYQESSINFIKRDKKTKEKNNPEQTVY